jgi:hypothetical protein
VYELYLVSPQADGSLKYTLSGRFALSADFVHVLLDRHCHLHDVPNGRLTPRKHAIINSLNRAMYYSVFRTAERLDAAVK